MKDSVYIIAEAGVNHNGDFDLAKSLIKIASDSGADAVKFQTFVASKLASKDISKATYQEHNSEIDNESQYEMLKKLELDKSEFKELKLYSDSLEIDFLSTPFDKESFDFLYNLNIKKIKIPSGEITNLPFIWNIAKSMKPLIISTGMSNLSDIKLALATVLHSYNMKSEPNNLDEIWEAWSKNKTNKILAEKVSILHCTSQYPAPLNEINLNCIDTLFREFGIPVGYSDHSEGIDVSLAAVAKGATIIEKHFTTDKNLEGPDHRASLEPDELIKMISGIRKIEKALGNKIKEIQPSEKNTLSVARQQVIAARDIQVGTIFSKEDLTTKRCGKGLPPHFIWELIGTKAKNEFKCGDLIEL